MSRKLSRKIGARKSLIKNLACSLVFYEKIETTLPKAKELKPFIERVLSIASAGDLTSRRRLISMLGNRLAVKKIFDIYVPKLDNKLSGNVKIFKIGKRKGDGETLCSIQLSKELMTAPSSTLESKAELKHNHSHEVKDESSGAKKSDTTKTKISVKTKTK